MNRNLSFIKVGRGLYLLIFWFNLINSIPYIHAGEDEVEAELVQFSQKLHKFQELEKEEKQKTKSPSRPRVPKKVNLENSTKTMEMLVGGLYQEIQKTQQSTDIKKERLTYLENLKVISDFCSFSPGEGEVISLTKSGKYLSIKNSYEDSSSSGKNVFRPAYSLILDLYEQAWIDLKLARMGLLASEASATETDREGLAFAIHRLDFLEETNADCLSKYLPEEIKTKISDKRNLEILANDDFNLAHFNEIFDRSGCSYSSTNSFLKEHSPYLLEVLAKHSQKEIAEIEKREIVKKSSSDTANEVFFVKDTKGNMIAVKKPNIDSANYNESQQFGVFNELFVNTFDKDHDGFFGVPSSAKQGNKTLIAFKNAVPFNQYCKEHHFLKVLRYSGESNGESASLSATSSPRPSSSGEKEEDALMDRQECLNRIDRVDSQKYVTLALLFNLDDSHCGNILLAEKGKRLVPISIDHGSALKANPVLISPRFSNCILDFPGLDDPVDNRIAEFFKNLDVDKTVAKMDQILGPLGKEIDEEQYQLKQKHFEFNLYMMKRGIKKGLTLKQILALRVPPFKEELDGKAIPQSEGAIAQRNGREGFMSLKKSFMAPSAWDRAWLGSAGHEVEVPKKLAQPVGFEFRKIILFQQKAEVKKDSPHVQSAVLDRKEQHTDSGGSSSGSVFDSGGVVEKEGVFNDEALFVDKGLPPVTARKLNSDLFKKALDQSMDQIKTQDLDVFFNERSRAIYREFYH
jgi:hypothetical protein